MPRPSFRQLYKSALLSRLYHPNPLPTRSAVVFAPHQDDETLGCGGTIAEKRLAGIPVWIVFLTDGGKSHRGLAGAEELRAMRQQEARDAGRVLGVSENDILFLDFPNGGLKDARSKAQERVEALLQEIQPDEVYVPSAWDFHYEHRITNEVVLAALAHLKKHAVFTHPMCLYEYPVWFWHQWPWVSLNAEDADERGRLIKRTLRYGFGLALLTEFRYSVSIHDCLPVKRAALDQYRSQTTRLSDNSNWKTLQDVSNGEFLNCFFQDYEVFRVRKV